METLSSKPGTNVSVAPEPLKKRRKGTWQSLMQQKYLYLMSMPFVIWLFVFNYVPIWGWTMAFQNYKPAKSFTEQKWVGFDNFVDLFQDERFYLVLRNTLAMSVMGLIANFIFPIAFACCSMNCGANFSSVRCRRFPICRTSYPGSSWPGSSRKCSPLTEGLSTSC